jgi:hypothetical protein
MFRSLTLLKLTLAGSLNRVRFDLARELVVLLSGGVVLVTFAYIINDFLNVQISGLSQVMRDRFAQPVAGTLLLLAAFHAGAVLRREFSGPETATRAAGFLGEVPAVLKMYQMLFGLVAVLLLHGFAWWLARTYLWQPSLLQFAAGEIILLLTTAASFYWYHERSKGREHDTSDWLTSRTIQRNHRIYAFARWRLAQIFLRNRTARACLLVALCLYALLIPLQANGIPFFASVACTILAGIVAASALFFQLAEDLNYAWAERTMGVSHDDFCRGYRLLSYAFAALMAVTAITAYVTGSLTLGHLVPNASYLLTLALINACTAVITPMLMFQIDGRRPMINMILLAITAMFIGTAVFASLFSLALVPVLGYYAHGSQNGRFYRA